MFYKRTKICCVCVLIFMRKVSSSVWILLNFFYNLKKKFAFSIIRTIVSLLAQCKWTGIIFFVYCVCLAWMMIGWWVEDKCRSEERWVIKLNLSFFSLVDLLQKCYIKFIQNKVYFFPFFQWKEALKIYAIIEQKTMLWGILIGSNNVVWIWNPFSSNANVLLYSYPNF